MNTDKTESSVEFRRLVVAGSEPGLRSWLYPCFIRVHPWPLLLLCLLAERRPVLVHAFLLDQVQLLLADVVLRGDLLLRLRHGQALVLGGHEGVENRLPLLYSQRLRGHRVLLREVKGVSGSPGVG